MNREHIILNLKCTLGFCSFFGAIYLLKKLIKGRKRAELAKKKNVFTVTSLQKQYEKFRKEGKKEIKLCIKGEIFSNNYFKNITNSNKIVFSKINEYPLYQNQSFIDIPNLTIIKSSQTFYLKDFFEVTKIPIFTDIRNQLEKISKLTYCENNQFKNSSILKSFILYFWNSIIIIISGIFSNVNILKGFEIGIKKSEFTVNLSTPIFLYCKVVISGKQPRFIIKGVKYLTSNLDELKNIFDNKNGRLIAGIFFLSFLSAILLKNNLGYVFQSVKSFFNELKKNYFLKKQYFIKINDEWPYMKKINSQSPLCKKCKINGIEVLFIPCLHFLYCRDCFNQKNKVLLSNLKCTECNRPVTKIVEFHQA